MVDIFGMFTARNSAFTVARGHNDPWRPEGYWRRELVLA